MEEKKRTNPCLGPPILILVALLLGMLSCANIASADIYTASAHGDATQGVNRSTATCENWPGGQCVTGSCAHCHDTFDPDICGNDPNGLMLFAPNENPTPDPQTDNFCYQCHKDVGSVQSGGITNYTYSKNFGGGSETFTTIYEAFNPTTGSSPSSHNLSDIQNYIAGEVGFSMDVNPCMACHNQHTAQQNFPVVASGLGGVKTAIRRPIDHESLPYNLWGDENYATSGHELIKNLFDQYSVAYQSPYFAGGSNYEPANDTTTNGSNLPNFITFCNDCHGHTDVPSTERARYLKKIDWGTATEHGLGHGNAYMGDTAAPYGNDSNNYVLCCTDCHEAHGSENEWLLRTCVNGTEVSIPGPNQWMDFCMACHTSVQQHTTPWNASADCSNNGICHIHGSFF
jgi:hypothetical protein